MLIRRIISGTESIHFATHFVQVLYLGPNDDCCLHFVHSTPLINGTHDGKTATDTRRTAGDVLGLR